MTAQKGRWIKGRSVKVQGNAASKRVLQKAINKVVAIEGYFKTGDPEQITSRIMLDMPRLLDYLTGNKQLVQRELESRFGRGPRYEQVISEAWLPVTKAYIPLWSALNVATSYWDKHKRALDTEMFLSTWRKEVLKSLAAGKALLLQAHNKFAQIKSRSAKAQGVKGSFTPVEIASILKKMSYPKWDLDEIHILENGPGTVKVTFEIRAFDGNEVHWAMKQMEARLQMMGIRLYDNFRSGPFGEGFVSDDYTKIEARIPAESIRDYLMKGRKSQTVVKKYLAQKGPPIPKEMGKVPPQRIGQVFRAAASSDMRLDNFKISYNRYPRVEVRFEIRAEDIFKANSKLKRIVVGLKRQGIDPSYYTVMAYGGGQISPEHTAAIIQFHSEELMPRG